MKTLLIFLQLAFLASHAQETQDPSQEILIFFDAGVEITEVNVGNVLRNNLKIISPELRKNLVNNGINISSLKPAIPNFHPKDSIKELPNGKLLFQPNMSRLFKYKVLPNQNKERLIKILNSIPGILYAESNGSISIENTPNDTRFNEQWALNNTLNPNSDIHAAGAWDIFTGNPNNIIGILDFGVDNSHPDINDKISGGDVGFSEQHGTFVAGIAAAESDNSQGISGVDWKAKIHSQRVDYGGDGETYNAVIDAVDYSPNLHVLNASFGLVYEDRSPGRNSITVRQAVAYAYKANRIFVAAMGNDQASYPNVTNYPAGFENVMAVGATDINDNITFFSSQGSHIDVSAPGDNVVSTKNGGYSSGSGTSFSAPHVSGLASLIKGYRLDLDNDDVINLIRYSCDDIENAGFDNASGYGRINAEKALEYLSDPFDVAHFKEGSGSTYAISGRQGIIFMGAGGLAATTYEAKRYEVRKNVSFSRFADVINIWGRGVETNGWSIINPNFGEGFCEVVPGTFSTSGATLRTYVYEIWSVTGAYLGFYPSRPENVEFAYSILGVSEPILQGPSEICSTNTYVLDNIIPGATVNWTVSSNIQIQNSTDSEVTIAPATSSSNGKATITYTITSSYGQFNKTKEIYLGKPSYSISSLDSNAPSTEAWAYINGSETPLSNQDIQSPTFTVVSSSGISTIQILGPYSTGNEFKIRAFGPDNNWNKTIDIHIQNPCGTTTKRVFLTPPPPSGGGCITSIQSSKNDLNTYIIIDPCSSTITSTETNYSYGKGTAANAQLNQYEMKVFDFNGTLVLENNSKSININSLGKGIYIIKGHKNGYEMTKKVLKQ